MVSTITSLTTWRRLAPIACRTASSFTRPLARISSRFTRLTAPMSSRKSAARLQQQQRRTDGGDVVGVERHHERAKAGVGHHLGLRDSSGLQSGVVRVDLRLRELAEVAPARSRAIMCEELPE